MLRYLQVNFIDFLFFHLDIVVKAKKRKGEGEAKKAKKHKVASVGLVSY